MKRYNDYQYDSKPRQWKSISFKSAFVIVIVLHIAAFTLLSFTGKKKIKPKETLAQEPQITKTIPEKHSKLPQSVTKPKVIADSSTKNTKPVPKPTPSTTPKYSPPKQTMIAKAAPEKELPKAEPTPEPPIPETQPTPTIASNTSQLPLLSQTNPPSLLAALCQEKEPAKPKTYVLTSGDNLYSVCRRLNVSFNDMVALNNIRDVRDLYDGLTLKIP
jgi:type IV secretory pathway VirB10-like protein